MTVVAAAVAPPPVPWGSAGLVGPGFAQAALQCIRFLAAAAQESGCGPVVADQVADRFAVVGCEFDCLFQRVACLACQLERFAPAGLSARRP